MLKNLSESLSFKGVRDKIAEATDGLGAQVEGRLKSATNAIGETLTSVGTRLKGEDIMTEAVTEEETPAEVFVRLLETAQIAVNDCRDEIGESTPQEVRDTYVRTANEAIADLHGFVAKFPVGSITLS